uniref:Secreted protein n=1 Tax=Oryzias latipes TaxID=8090 RepID=A0A3B3ILB8_ORYLA
MHHPHPPSFSPTGAAVSSCLFILQSCRLLRCSAENVSVKSGLNIVTSVKKNGFLRLPGLCRRLKRRRVTLLVEISNKISPGQVCRCPRHSKCSHFFLHSL